MLSALLLAACATKAPPQESLPVTADPLAERPDVGPAPAFTAPTPTTFRLGDDGAEVWLVERPGLPLVSVRLLVPGGQATDRDGARGLARFTDRMMTQGAGDRDATAFAEAVERKALTLSVSTWPTTSVVQLDAHADRLGEGLALMADAVLRPRFDAPQVDIVRDQMTGDITQSLDDPRTVASWAASRLYWGQEHALAYPALGTPDDLAGLDRGDLQGSWSARYTGDGVRFVVSGDIDEAELRAALSEHFPSWTAGVAPSSVTLPPAGGVPSGTALWFVDNPGASQSVLRVVMPGWTVDDPQLMEARLGVIALGGIFTSRLNRLLREEKGYTYGARAGVTAADQYGLVVASTAVRADVTADALVDLLDQLTLIREGIDETELEKARGAHRTSVVSAMERRAGIADTFTDAWSDGRPPQTFVDELNALDAATLDGVNAALEKIDLSAATVVVVGDLAQVRAAVEAKGLGDWQVLEM
ncbi:MAG: insulinase family protein [Alphaproteobacteria bacterium]|nr:insulinase family protein [Alphaproteobacteria bacterium]